jgi:chaperone LolA
VRLFRSFFRSVFRPALAAFSIGAFGAASLGTAVLPSTALASPAEPVSVEELVTALEGTYKDVKSLKAEFVQTVSSPVAGESKQRGRVLVKAPRMARWETLGDQGSAFITNGAKIWVYTPAVKQVMVMQDLSGGGGGNVDLLSLLDDMSKLDEQFTVTMLDDGGGRKPYRVSLVPKVAGGSYQKVELVISRKKFVLAGLVIYNAMGDRIELDFSSVKLNAEITDANFEFAIPEGVTVIEG